MPSSIAALAEDWLLTAANWIVELIAFARIIAIFAEPHCAVSARAHRSRSRTRRLG